MFTVKCYFLAPKATCKQTKNTSDYKGIDRDVIVYIFAH